MPTSPAQMQRPCALPSAAVSCSQTLVRREARAAGGGGVQAASWGRAHVLTGGGSELQPDTSKSGGAPHGGGGGCRQPAWAGHVPTGGSRCRTLLRQLQATYQCSTTLVLVSRMDAAISICTAGNGRWLKY